MRRKPGWSAVRLLVLAPVLAIALTACGGDTKDEATATAAAKAAVPATAAAPAKVELAVPLIVTWDTVWGSKGMSDADKPLRSCVETSRVKRGESVGWRIKIIDPVTGKTLDDTGIASVTVKLGDGTDLAVEYGPHGGKPPSDTFWAIFWTIPDTYPTGVLPYTISVKAKDGRAIDVKHDRFLIPSSYLTVGA